ncbi:Organophosphate reductase [Thermobacillus xylanilyticus]|uniref:Organophosphate reductase n=1 Tax=Thermobacillus xylanilyticus TaxID=76633 RepID=A0ABM8V9J0_THEXY|nr:aldo/keto reductase [Thermobacillus xylanilyticus]CAG5093196.1 Organophosphate reductase [Thermobacillus xylanilyticus]
MQTVTLSNGVNMPIIGIGLWQVNDAQQAEDSVYEALMAGYRLIDTAAGYLNEEAVGRAIKRSGIPREEIFVTTKIWVQDAGYESAKRAFEKSLKKLQLDYLDLYLIHQPFGDYYGTWRAMEELYREGLIRAIGVSNFLPDRLMDLAQVVLRWLVQRNIVVIPKSVRKERIIENFNIFDFELDADDMERIKTLDTGNTLFLSYHDPEVAKMMGSWKVDL